MIESVSKERLEELLAFHNTRAVMALAPEERRYHEDSHAAWLELLRLRDSARDLDSAIDAQMTP